MTTDRHAAPRAVALLAAVVLAVTAALTLAASPAVADTGPAAGTRVAASNHDPGVGVGPEGDVSAGERRGTTTPQPETVVGSCVAPQTTGSDDCDGYVWIHKAPLSGMGSVWFARGFEAGDFPGGPDDPYSDGYAYFAVDRWIAEEYEPQGPYQDGIISVRIPRDEYDSYWKAFERSYASTGPDGQTRRGTQLAIPSAMVSGLNGYLRLWPT